MDSDYCSFRNSFYELNIKKPEKATVIDKFGSILIYDRKSAS